MFSRLTKCNPALFGGISAITKVFSLPNSGFWSMSTNRISLALCCILLFLFETPGFALSFSQHQLTTGRGPMRLVRADFTMTSSTTHGDSGRNAQHRGKGLGQHRRIQQLGDRNRALDLRQAGDAYDDSQNR